MTKDIEAPPPREAPGLHWGVIGPGRIAASFVQALRAHTEQRVVPVGSRDAERARAFADRFGIPSAYGSYAEVLDDAWVDIVYIASPHSEHYTHALMAIEAGKHVLVEKAFTRDAGEAEQLIEAAHKQGVFCMEAMWTRFLPHMDVVRQVLDLGLLGEVRTVTADHGQFMSPDKDHRLFAPELAGGALLDLGVYPVSFAAMVLGPFASLAAVGDMTHTGVDGQVWSWSPTRPVPTACSTPRSTPALRPPLRSRARAHDWRSRVTSTHRRRSA